MKTKFAVTFIKLEDELFGSVINVEVFQRKSIFQRWKKVDVVEATCKSWNCWDGHEWYNNNRNYRMTYKIEEMALQIAQKALKKKFVILPGMINWKELKERFNKIS